MVPVALAVKAAHLLGGAAWASGWLHLQAIGAVALMILAVMPRAMLGHTGHAAGGIARHAAGLGAAAGRGAGAGLRAVLVPGLLP